MKSLVAGGAGFIGSHLVDALVRQGDEVIVLDRLHPKYPNQQAVYCLHDLAADYQHYIHHFEGVDRVFHLAALIAIPYCMEHPSESMANNVLAVMHTLEAARLQGVSRFVFASSAAVYGDSLFLPSVETNASRCMNTYALSKYTGEQLCRLYHDLYGMKSMILRLFNVYGDRQHEGGQYAPVMGVFLRQKAKHEPLTIYGEGYQTRDFVHVSDVVRAALLAGEVELERYGEVFNVGTGEGLAIETIADLISDHQQHLEARPGEQLHSRADIRKIQAQLGWKPTIDLLAWLKRHC